MVLMVAWYFGTSRVEGLDQSAWVHHLVAVQLRALFILIMVIIRVIFHFVESNFQFIKVAFILLSSVLV